MCISSRIASCTHDFSVSQSGWFQIPTAMRFDPTDQELVTEYLQEKSNGTYEDLGLIPTIDIYKHEPQHLQGMTYNHGDGRVYFFSHNKKLGKNKTERMTESKRGTWKASRVAQRINDVNGAKIGEKVSLVYYVDVADASSKKKDWSKTNWLMKEYRLNKEEDVELVLVVVYYHGKGNERIDRSHLENF